MLEGFYKLLHFLFLYGFNVSSKKFLCDLEIGPLVKFFESGGICEKQNWLVNP